MKIYGRIYNVNTIEIRRRLTLALRYAAIRGLALAGNLPSLYAQSGS